MMTVESQEDESSELLLLGGCSLEICITASVNVGIAPAADHDDGQNDKSLEEEPGAADDSGDDRCWDNQQQQPEGRHLQKMCWWENMCTHPTFHCPHKWPILLKEMLGWHVN